MKRLILTNNQLFEITDKGVTQTVDLAKTGDININDLRLNNEYPTKIVNTEEEPKGQISTAKTGLTQGQINKLAMDGIEVNVEGENNFLSETLTKKELEEIRLSEIRKRGILLSKRELNEYLTKY